MKISTVLPLLVGVAILALGLYLVSSHGYLGGTYLPGLIGIQPCNSPAAVNGTGCTGFALYGGFGPGTIVAIFGLGLITSSLRRALSSAGSGTTPLPPELTAVLASAQSRMASMAPPGSPGARPGTVYCSRCGAANPSEAKFCHQCAAQISGGPPNSSPVLPPSDPPRQTG